MLLLYFRESVDQIRKMEDLTDELNNSIDTSRRFEHVKDNQKSVLRLKVKKVSISFTLLEY